MLLGLRLAGPKSAVIGLFLGLAVGSPPSRSTSWAPRDDLGVAMVDRRTGAVVWEAWEPGDVPPDASRAVRDEVERLLDSARSGAEQDAPGATFPLRLGSDRIVHYAYSAADNRHRLTLCRGTPERRGDTIAEFSAPNGPIAFAAHDRMLYVVVDLRLSALTIDRIEAGAWQPRWSYDLADERTHPVEPPWMSAGPEGVWLSHGGRIVRLDRDGGVAFEARVEPPRSEIKPGLGAPLGLGASLIYWRHGSGVVAVDRATRREVWRVPTYRAPYPSRVAEVGSDGVLVQVGSDAPPSLRGAFASDRHPLSALGVNDTRRRVTAATLLHAYGDGYARGTLRRWAHANRDAPDAGARKAAAAIDRIVSAWPARRDRKRLLRAAVDALVGPAGEDREDVSGGLDRLLTWSLVEELLYGDSVDGYGRPGLNYVFRAREPSPMRLPEDRRSALALHCREIIEHGPSDERGFAAAVLVSKTVAEDEIGPAEEERLLGSTHESVWRWMGTSLARRGRRERLLELASRRPAADHLDVVYLLAQGRPTTWTPGEERFWLACARKTPSSVAYVLDLTDSRPVPLAFREPIRGYLVRAARTTPGEDSMTQAEYDLAAALRILHAWGRSEDTALLREFTRFPNRHVRGHAEALARKRPPQLPRAL